MLVCVCVCVFVCVCVCVWGVYVCVRACVRVHMRVFLNTFIPPARSITMQQHYMHCLHITCCFFLYFIHLISYFPYIVL